MIPIGRGEGGTPLTQELIGGTWMKPAGWATSTSGIGRGFSLNVDRINLGVLRFSRFLRNACAKASTENRPLIAAVNRCATQNQSQDRVFQHSVQRLRKKYSRAQKAHLRR